MKKKQGISSPSNCQTPPKGELSSFQKIVNDYQAKYQKDNELDFYKNLSSIEEVIEKAAFAKWHNDKRHPHQYRLKNDALNEVFISLMDDIEIIKEATDFEELFLEIDKAIHPIHGIGELMVYDTALRIGGFMELHPTKVHLHRGARMGANILGIGKGKRAVDINEFAKEFQVLKAYEIEDCLCIYKDELAKTINID